MYYIKVNENNEITSCIKATVGAYTPQEGDIQLDDSYGDENLLPPINQFNKGKEIFYYKFVDGQIVKKSEEELFSLSDYKEEKLQYYSDLSFSKRQTLLPDYKLVNASLGIYPTETTNSYKTLVENFRTEFYRIKSIIDEATDKTTIDSIVENYPTSL